MSEIFKNDTKGNTYSLKPVLVIDETGTDPIYFSTHSLTLEDILNPVFNILKEIPRIRETLDLEKSAIKNHHLSFTFYNYGRAIEGFKNISELFGAKKLLNKRADLYFLSQSAKKLEDGFKIFSGFIKKAKHKKDVFQMDAESLAGVLFSAEVPSRQSKIAPDNFPLARKDHVGKYLPIIFGEIDYSPAFMYQKEILTSSPDFHHKTLKDKFVKIGTAEYPVLPVAVYQGGYWVISPGPMTFNQTNTGLAAIFENLYYEPQEHQPGGLYYNNYNNGASITLKDTGINYSIIIKRNPVSIQSRSKSELVTWQIVKNHATSNPDVIEESKDWYSLDLTRGSGSVEIESIDQYFRDVNEQYLDLPSEYKNSLMDLLSDYWVKIKGISWQANDENNLSGSSYQGKFLTESNYTQLIFNYRPLSEYIPSEWSIVGESNKNALLTRIEIDGSSDLPIVTQSDVTVGFIEYSAGDSLVHDAACNLHLTIQKNNEGPYNNSIKVGPHDIADDSENVILHDIEIEHGQDNAKTFDNVFSSDAQLTNTNNEETPLPSIDSLAFGIPKQQTTGHENHNGWKGDADSAAPTFGTGYANVRWNVEAKIFGAEMIGQCEVDVSELDLFASVNGVKINQNTFMDLQSLHFSDADVDSNSLEQHPAVVNSLLVEKYSNIKAKKDGLNSLKAAVDYSVSNWNDSYYDLPSSVRLIIDTIVKNDEWYRTRSSQEYKLDFYIDKLQTVQSLFDDISQSTTSVPYLSPSSQNELQFINIAEKYDDNSIAHFKNDSGQYVKHSDIAVHIKESDLLSYNFELSDTNKVYNQIDAEFGFDAALQEFRYKFTLSAEQFLGNKYDSTIFGVDKKIKKLPLSKFKRAESAVRYAAYFLMMNCNRHLEVHLDMPTKFMFLQIGDLIVFDELLGGVKPYNLDYTKDYDSDLMEFITTNGQKVFKYFLITEATKSLKGIKIKAVQMHDLAPFKESGLVGCSDQEGDIVNGLLCVKTPDNFSSDVNVGISNFCNHVVGCVDASASNYQIDSDGDPVDGNGNKITLSNPAMCEFVVEEETEEEEEETGQSEDENVVEDPDEEAEDDTVSDYALGYTVESISLNWQSVTNPEEVTDSVTFSFDSWVGEDGSNHGTPMISNMVKLNSSIKYLNSTDNYSFEDLMHGTDSISNTSDAISFLIDPNDDGTATQNVEGFDFDNLEIYLKKTSGELVLLNNVPNDEAGGFFNELFGQFTFHPSGTQVYSETYEVQTIDFNAIEHKNNPSFSSLNDEQMNTLFETLLSNKIINGLGEITFSLKIKFITESFVDEFGNTVEAVSLNEPYKKIEFKLKPDIRSVSGSYFVGDVNLDNTINILDIVSMVNYILNNVEYNYLQAIISDVNLDSTTNILDIIAQLNNILNNNAPGLLETNNILNFYKKYYTGTTVANEISITHNTIGFYSFVRPGAVSKILFLPSPDGTTILNSDLSAGFYDAFENNSYDDLMNGVGIPAEAFLKENTPVSFDYNAETQEFESYDQGDIRKTENILNFDGEGLMEYLIAVAIVKNLDGTAEVKTKSIKIIL